MLIKTLQEHWEMCINLRRGNTEQKAEANEMLRKANVYCIEAANPIKAKALKNIVPKRKQIKVIKKNG